MNKIKVRGLVYTYREHGHGPPLVLLHGFTGSRRSWEALLPSLGREHRLLAVDLLGHGSTSAPANPGRCAMPEAAQDMVEIIDRLADGSCHLLGYSMGGRLALYLAVHHPTRLQRLVLESSSPGLADTGERAARQAADEQLAAQIERGGLPAFIAEWESLPLFASQAGLPGKVRQKLHTQRLHNRPHGLANSLRGMGSGVQPSLWADLPAINCPTLLITGELDPKFIEINRRMAAAMPNAQLLCVPGAGHAIHLEQPGFFSQAVLDFL